MIAAENIDDISRIFVMDFDENLLCEAQDTNIRQFSVEEYKRIEKAHTKKYKDLRKKARDVRREDGDLVSQEFIDGILDKERARKAELMETGTGDPETETVCDDGNTGGVHPRLWEAVLRNEKRKLTG